MQRKCLLHLQIYLNDRRCRFVQYFRIFSLFFKPVPRSNLAGHNTFHGAINVRELACGVFVSV